jgi:hypothetical protein
VSLADYIVEAESALRALGMDILSDTELAAYNDTRNDGASPNPEAAAGTWTCDGIVLSKVFYVRDPSGEELGLYRRAFFGDWDSAGATAAFRGIVVEDYNGREIKA